jgi:hypothetical protein
MLRHPGTTLAQFLDHVAVGACNHRGSCSQTERISAHIS